MNLKLNTALRDGLGFRCSKFNGVIWLNAEHLGGVPLGFESCRGELGAFALAKGWGSL